MMQREESRRGEVGQVTQPCVSSRKRAAARIDFEALPAIPERGLRQAASKDITLRTATAQADTLLPEDIHYQAGIPSLTVLISRLQVCKMNPANL
jgi:hypothetical protein